MSDSQALFGKTAVLEGLPDHPAVKALVAWNAEALLDAKFDRAELTLTVAPNEIRAACEKAKAAGYNFFEDLTAVDWFPASPRFRLSYALLSHRLKERIRLSVPVEEPDRQEPKPLQGDPRLRHMLPLLKRDEDKGNSWCRRARGEPVRSVTAPLIPNGCLVPR